MRPFLYAAIVVPILITATTFAWVLKGERKLVASMNVALPALGDPVKSDDPNITGGQKLFNEKGCVYCHGPNGAGGVKNNNAQGGEVPALSKVAEGYTAEELKVKISEGVREIGKADPNGPTPPLYMPVWQGHLSEDELGQIAAFLMSLAPKKAGGDDDF